VKDIRANNKDPLIQNAQYTDRLIKLLEQNERYGQITYDIAATDAVIANNKAMTAPGLMNIIDGGNKAALCKLICCDVPAEEFTMKGYQSTSGIAFVATQMILDFSAKAETPILKPDVTRVGISNMPSPLCGNLIQVLYVMVPNQPPSQEMWNQHQQNQAEIALVQQQYSQAAAGQQIQTP
jgi:hypothetical protein